MAEDKEPTLEELMAELDAGLTLEGAPDSGAAPGAAETDTSEFEAELGLLARGAEASAELEPAAAARASTRTSSPSSVGSDVGVATARLGSPPAVAADDLRATVAAQYELAAAGAEAPAVEIKVWTRVCARAPARRRRCAPH